ncbi:epoxide hydrolase family protein [Pseudalkalibacillus salsuginis]|uniref:epoxide hydrolase family protein n=1 Tax=Pseudalkalibacillus salsuginis TaxID=2910972 RepID=UPI001F24C712|nr:epoxide hydrolase family protein [Pseudalkalibacillus salsuginis]MCF6411312.1 epoxide hydrolase [Pseudalkalibacillus salsuginis]
MGTSKQEFGKSNINNNDTTIRPFRIAISQKELDDLQARLTHTRWPDELPNVDRDYGVSIDYLRDISEYWRTSYDWRKHESRLNKFPQFTTTIDGANVHFLHVRSPEKDAFPLILTHGWPGSIVEFLDVIGPLTNPKAYGGNPTDAFHLVIPSIPGYGFSGPTLESGWNVNRIALAWAELMRRLGYDRYGAQGGDWGSAISRNLGAVDSKHVCGVHLNYLPTVPTGELNSISNKDEARIEQMKSYLATPAGYMVLQSTKPQTLSYALTDSPIGQLAWIAEKFIEWTDPKISVAVDYLLTNVMIYWLTRTAGSSARLYYENTIGKRGPLPCSVPLGVAVFPYDIVLPIRHLAERQYDIVHWTEFDRGGHFAALETPNLLTEDIQSYFRRFR